MYMTNSLANYCKNNSQIISFVVVCLLIGTIVFLMSKGSSNKSKNAEMLDAKYDKSSEVDPSKKPDRVPGVNMSGPSPSQSSENENYAKISDSSSVTTNTMKTNPSELLPNDTNSHFASLIPTGASPNLLGTTSDVIKPIQGPVNRNKNLQLRSEHIIEKVDVSPWNQTTIMPDTMQRQLEIGN